MDNITGKAVTDRNYLKTRLFLIDELRDFVRKASVIIEAPRRFGKTSVIKEFIRQEGFKEEKEKEFNILFLELEGEDTLNDFCFKLFKELLSLYRYRKRLDKIAVFLGDTWNVLASRIPKIEIPELEIELRKKTRDMDFSQWKEKLSPMFAGLNSFDKKTVIVFDEFPDMLMNFKNKDKEPLSFKNAVDSLTGWLRSLRQKEDDTCKYQFVFCGSVNLRKTLEDIGISKRINDLEPFLIPPMKSGEPEILIEALLKKYTIEIEPDGRHFMVSKIVNGSPYFGQIFMKALREARKMKYTCKEVRSVYDAMLRGGNHDLNHFHSRLNDYLSPVEKECSGIILKNLCFGGALEKEFFDIYLYDRCSYEVFLSVVNRLIYEGYITRDINTKGQIKFVSTLLKDWWACKVGVN